MNNSLGSKLKNSLLLFLMTLSVFFVYSTIAYILVQILAFVSGSFTLSDLKATDFESIGQLSILVFILAMTAAFLFMKVWLHIKGLKLSFKRLTKRDILIILKYFGLHFVVLILTAFLFQLLGIEADNDQQEIQKRFFDNQGIWLTILLTVIIVPIFEESLFRGFFFAGLRRHLKFFSAFLFSSAFFTVLHLNFESTWQENLYIFAVIFGLSYFITLTFEKTNNLWAPAIFHTLHNLRAVLVVFFLP